MDKIRLILLLIFISSLSACDKFYKIDKDFFVDDNHSEISSINGFVKANNGIFVYGNSEYFNHSSMVIPKGKSYGLIKLTDNETIDTSFKNPFSYPVSINEMLKLQDGKYLVFYKRLKEAKKIEVGLLDHYGNLEKLDFELSEILNKSLNEELMQIESTALDSIGNVYFSLNSNNSNQASLLFKLTPSLNIDLGFQQQILENFKIEEINQIHIQPDNMIIISGRFVFISNSNEYQNLCKIDINGKIDSDFCQNLPKFETNNYNCVNTTSLIDSSIYIGGNFTVNLTNHKISNLIRINKNGSINIHQPNKNDLFKYKDDEPYFEKTTILTITEMNDSLLIVSGIFNQFNNKKTKIPISIIRKDGNQIKDNFCRENEIFMINSVYLKNTDTIYVFGNSFINKYHKFPLARFIKR